MTSRTYYNEIDPYAAAWLRNLIAAGHIASGEVDQRSIVDVRPSDLDGFRQCHFFAGIAGWSLALRLAGWPDDRPVWTGSCPCQPFSAAGKRGGFADERHLWPEFFRLIRALRPAIVLGEQVASRDGLEWLDAVSADLEGADYAFGAADLCAAGVGAPHIRQRLWWVGLADADAPGWREQRGAWLLDGERQAQRHDADGRGPVRLLADSRGAGPSPREREDLCGSGRQLEGRAAQQRDGASALGMGDAAGQGRHSGERGAISSAAGGDPRSASDEGHGHAVANSGAHGPWSDLEWLLCRDGKLRPTRPGLFPLAHGVSARVGKLRAAGNAIVPQVGAAFVEAVMECAP